MPPPSSFLTITSFPYTRTVTVAEFNAGTYGTAANEVWFKYVPAADGVLGVSRIDDPSSSMRVIVYETDALTVIRDGLSRSLWAPITSGLNYWIKCRKSAGTTISADIDVEVQLASLSPTVSPGDIVINDDSAGAQYAVVYSVDGTFKGFKAGIPSGENGDSVENGIQLWHDRFGLHGGRLSLHDADGNFLLATDTTPTLSNVFPHVVAHPSGKFYVVNRNGSDAGKVYTVTDAGVVSGLVADLNQSTHAVGVNIDETILYYIPSNISPDRDTIKKWDLVNDVDMGDLYAVPALDPINDDFDFGLTALNLQPGEILVLSDGSLVTYYQHNDDNESVLLHVSASGSLLHSYMYSWATPLLIDHIAWAPGDPTYIRLWLYTELSDGNSGRIQELNINTGSAAHTFDADMFVVGLSKTSTNNPFGPSNSCTMITAKRSSALDDSADSGDGGSETIPTCCDEGGPPGGGDTGVNPDPVGTLPPWMASCTGGGFVDGVADLSDGESWL